MNRQSYRKPTAASRSRVMKAALQMAATTTKAQRFARISALRGARPGFQQLTAVIRGRGARGETKSVDIPAALFTQNFNAGNSNSQSLTLVQEGAGFYNRIGRKIAMKSLHVRAQIQPQGAVGALVEETVRYIIGFDKQPNGVACTWNQVVQAYDNAGAATNACVDGINLDNRDRFIILRDRTVVMPRVSATGFPTSAPFGTSTSSVGSSSASDCGANIVEYIRLNNLEAQFNGTANPATVAQISTGNLFIITQGSTGGQYQYTGSARLRFTDF